MLDTCQIYSVLSIKFKHLDSIMEMTYLYVNLLFSLIDKSV